MTTRFLRDSQVSHARKCNKQHKRRIHLIQQINMIQKMQSYSIQRMHQGNQEFFEASQLIQGNALGRKLSLHQRRKPRNEFDLKLQDTVNL